MISHDKVWDAAITQLSIPDRLAPMRANTMNPAKRPPRREFENGSMRFTSSTIKAASLDSAFDRTEWKAIPIKVVMTIGARNIFPAASLKALAIGCAADAPSLRDMRRAEIFCQFPV